MAADASEAGQEYYCAGWRQAAPREIDKLTRRSEFLPNLVCAYPPYGSHHGERLRAILGADPCRWRILTMVASLDLPDCWVGAGFVRNAVWDSLHDYGVAAPMGDVDVVWFDAARADPAVDREVQARLCGLDGDIAWSVKNQSRMHVRNGDPPYRSATDAMRHWPETATAVGVRWEGGDIGIAAPFGLDDLFDLVVRPTARFQGEKHQIFLDRVRDKRWQERWPKLRSPPR
jgi:hypothetical protein